jgi:enamine deaminase RidA (YjgF/YER057c/UK114 family)
MFEKRLEELQIELPETPKPLAAYIPALQTGTFVYTSGQLPMKNGVLVAAGKVGKEVGTEDAQSAARVAVINCLSAIKSVIGSLDKIEQIVKITVFVNSAEGYTDQPVVANGASELLLQIFGDAGKHTRSAVGVSELPRNAAVEVELVASVR